MVVCSGLHIPQILTRNIFAVTSKVHAFTSNIKSPRLSWPCVAAPNGISVCRTVTTL